MEQTRELIAQALALAATERDEAGRSEQGRSLAVCVTSLETALLWYDHAGRTTETGEERAARYQAAAEKGIG